MVTDALGRPHAVLLLGGSSEIGLAIVTEFVNRGASQVVLAGRASAALDRAVVDLSATGASISTIPFDADNVTQHPAVIEAAVDEAGDIDVAVLAFGTLGRQEHDEVDPPAAVAVARTNYLGAVSVLTVLANRMRTQGHGKIIVLSSVAGERVRRSNYVYGSSKAGLDGFALGLAESLRGTGASLLVVRPGFVHGRMTAGRKAAPLSTTPAAVAQATVHALDHNADLIWVPALLRLLMLVLRHLPRAVLRRLPI